MPATTFAGGNIAELILAREALDTTEQAIMQAYLQAEHFVAAPSALRRGWGVALN